MRAFNKKLIESLTAMNLSIALAALASAIACASQSKDCNFVFNPSIWAFASFFLIARVKFFLDDNNKDAWLFKNHCLLLVQVLISIASWLLWVISAWLIKEPGGIYNATFLLLVTFIVSTVWIIFERLVCLFTACCSGVKPSRSCARTCLWLMFNAVYMGLLASVYWNKADPAIGFALLAGVSLIDMYVSKSVFSLLEKVNGEGRND